MVVGRKYFEKFMDAFATALGYGFGIGIAVLFFSVLVLKVLENTEISMETAQAFGIITATIAFIIILLRMQR